MLGQLVAPHSQGGDAHQGPISLRTHVSLCAASFVSGTTVLVQTVDMNQRSDECVRKTDCSGKTRFVLHLAHHELESIASIFIITIRDECAASTLYLPIHLCTAVSH